jgi:hypothetical protein
MNLDPKHRLGIFVLLLSTCYLLPSFQFLWFLFNESRSELGFRFLFKKIEISKVSQNFGNQKFGIKDSFFFLSPQKRKKNGGRDFRVFIGLWQSFQYRT